MAKLKDGFYKQIATTLGDNAYVLLAGGGSKAVSDFATISGVVTALGTNGDYVTWTKNGTANNLTVPYATKSGSLVGIYASALPSNTFDTGAVKYYYNILLNTEGLFPHNNNANSILTVSKHQGSYLSQLGFSSDKRLYFRSANGEDINSLGWNKVAYVSEIPTKISQLTNDSGFVTGGPYLSLAGGNMNNAAVVTFTANGTLRQTTATTSNATSIVEWYKGTSKDTNYTHPAQIGWHNTGDTDGAIYLVPYPTSTDPWVGTVGLYIGKNTIKWKNQPLIHSGNISSYALTSLPDHSHPYLPIAGGTMNSDAYIGWKDRGAWGNASATYPYSYGGLSWSGTSDWIKIYAKEAGSDSLNLVFDFGDDSGHYITFRDNGSEYTMIHSGNIGSYAITSHQSLANYVTLDSTQTISGIKTFSGGNVPIKLNSTGNEVGVQFLLNGTAKGWVGYTNTTGAYIYSYPSGKYIGVKDDGTPYYYNGGFKTLLHTGNAPYVQRLYTRNDFEYYVVLLCKYGTALTGVGHRATGKIYSEGGGVGRYVAADIDVWVADWSSGYDSQLRFDAYGTKEMDLVTCTYGGTKYLAIRIIGSQAKTVYFEGTSTEMLFTPIQYYNNSTGAVSNSEIYNSISPITVSQPYSNGIKYALVSEIPAVTNYYWADQLITSSAKSNATPTFGNVNIKSGTDAGLAIYTSGDYSRIRFYNSSNSNNATIHYFATAYSGYTFAKDSLNVGGKVTIGAWNNPTMFITQNTSTTDTSGCVGIGTTNPTTKLHVIGDVRLTGTNPAVYIRNTNTAADTYSIIRFGNADGDNKAYIFLNGPSRTSDGGQNVMTIRNNVGYLRLDNATSVTGLLTVTSGSTHCGIKVGNNYINAINGELIIQNNTAIRFGDDAWDYDVWAGLRYVSSAKTIHLGIADKSVFSANNALGGGTLNLPGIHHISSALYNIKVGSVASHTPSTTGWYTIAQVSGYFNYDIYITGGWNNGMPSTVRVNICNINGTSKITQLAGYVGSLCSQIRLGRVSTNVWDVQVYITAQPGTMGEQRCIFTGFGGLTIHHTSTLASTSYSATNTLAFGQISGISLTTDNYTSYLDGRYYTETEADNRFVNVTGDTMTGSLTFSTDSSITWSRNTDYASIRFQNTGDGDTNSYLDLQTGDNGNEYIRLSRNAGGTTYSMATFKSDGARISGLVWSESNSKYLRIGPQNSSHAHYETDASVSHWFNKTVQVDGNIEPYGNNEHSAGSTSYRFSNVYSYAGNFAGTVSMNNLVVINDSCNTSYDALAYFQHRSNNDWTVKVDSGSYDYGLHIACAHTATNALNVVGASRFSNTLRIGNGTNTFDGNYCEGLRIRAADSTWATIILGATADTGTNTYAWSIHRTSGNNFSISRNSSDGGNGLLIDTSGRVGIGTTSPSEKLSVNGWVGTIGNTGWYSITYTGGVYMTDSTWVRIYNNKKFYVSNNSSDAIHSAGGVYVAGAVHAYANYLKSTCNSCTVTIGSQNSSYCHYETTAPQHWFNKTVRVQGDVYGGSGYNRRLAYCDEIYAYALPYNGWWNSGSGQNVDNANGMTFVYGNHGSPNGWGILCTFDYQYNSSYKFQLFAEGYSAAGMYYRCRSADRGGWTGWKTVIDSGNIGSQSVNYATSAGNADTVDGQHFSYSNSSNSPTYLWATNSNGSSFLAARGSISVNYANSAGSATKATQDGNGNTISSYYVTLSTTQTISGAKTFSTGVTVNGTVTFGGSDSYGIRTSTDNYVNIGETGKRFYQCYVKTYYATNGFYQDSDIRLKNIIQNVEVNLEDLTKLQKVYYTWKSGIDTNTHIGMIAQEVQKLYPELVNTDKDTGYLSLAYDQLSVIALKAIDKLYAVIKDIQRENKYLKERLNQLEYRIS